MVDPVIVKETGQNPYNIKFNFAEPYLFDYGVISQDRLRLSCGGGPIGYTYSLEWVDEQTAENIRKMNNYFVSNLF